MKRRRFRWWSLEAKAVIGLVVIAMMPLAVAVIMVKGVAVAAQNVALEEGERMHAALDRASLAYKEAVDARQTAFRRSAEAIALQPDLRDACAKGGVVPQALVDHELGHDPSLAKLELGGAFHGQSHRDTPAGVRAFHLDLPLVENHACTVSLTFVSDTGAQILDDLKLLGDVLREHRLLEKIRRTLPPSYRSAFVLVVGGFAVAAVLLGIFLARRMTSRIHQMVEGTRRVADGDLETRVALRGSDELADLAHAFDDMVVELYRSRNEIEYLQKIGAWQEIARRLAHEIKNPLTPIQLAVQQLHNKYAGDDPRFQKMLDDASEIVTEEIAGLRRLVDAFSGFAKLPRVEPKPLDLAQVIEDVSRDVPGIEHAKQVVFEQVPPAAAIRIAGDRLLLRRALVNLVENAAQAGAKKVVVTWKLVGAVAEIVLEDDGPGVPPELYATLFDPYVTTKPHGTGLGLAIVKKTILEHGGTIAIAPGRSPLGGASFLLTLPILEPPADTSTDSLAVSVPSA